MSVCARIRRILHVDKVGHAGTLDPMAEGVLPVALGRACKSVTLAGEGRKTYEAGMLLGVVTDTQDITGAVLQRYEGSLPSEDAVREAVRSFSGGYEQLTPMYSARQVNGRRLYDIARSGEEAERPLKQIGISCIEVTEIDLPHVKFTVTCTGGTYVRTICHDIGMKLGCGACMESLRRTSVGSFQEQDALSFSDVEALERSRSVDTALRVISPTAVAIGKFDGTHLGHQALLRELRREAEKQHLRSLVLVIDAPGRALQEREERRNRLLSLGIDYVIELPLTEELKNRTAEDFLENILLKKLSMKFLIGGTDLGFGKDRLGNASFLSLRADEYGFRFRLIEKVCLPAVNTGEAQVPQEISSTLVRKKLSEGDMEGTAELLGTPFSLSGKIIRGRHIGTDVLGAATVNLPVDETRELPPFGVYVSRVGICGREDRRTRHDLTAPRGNMTFLFGISNLGKKPTVNNGLDPLSLETHILDRIPGDSDLCGQEIRVELLHFLRPERRFASFTELKEQIFGEDLPQAEQFLTNFKAENRKILAK